ncbi:MAG: AAA family ATPase [Cucumibacter sp.]
MKFERLRLIGFKSFVESTELYLEPGLTGIVGPNGCGKSNLVEALRWVMGESSYKSMRAAGMDEVIFSGSGNRPARNTAEVTLVLDNADRSAPALLNTADTLEVTRRIEREAGSIYRVNGREVRARDVQLLFADASTGAHSPSLVRQGRIGELIAAKPVERRQLLEEAAGISGLHSRRHEAELRLRAAEQNLERVDDIVAQIEEQLAGLKKQARQAVRYRSISGEIRRAEATLYYLRWVAARFAERETEAGQAQVARRLAEAGHAEHVARERLEQAQGSLQPLRHAEAEANAALQRLRIGREQLEREARQAEARRSELNSRLAQIGADATRDEALVSESRGALGRLGEEAGLLNAAAGSQADEAEAASAAADEAQRTLSVADGEVRRQADELAQLRARRASLERGLADAGARVGRVETEIAEVEGEATGIAGELGGNRTNAERRASVEAARARAEATERAALAAEHAASLAAAEFEVARPSLLDAEAGIARLDTEAKTIAKLLKIQDNSLWPPILDGLTVTHGFEGALGAAFGDELDASADAGAPIHWGEPGDGSDDPALPAEAKPLADFVKGPALLRRKLQQIGVVEAEAGGRLAAALAPGQVLVSIEGDQWRWDGFVARGDAPSAPAQRLAQRNRLADIDAELAALNKVAAREKGRVEALAQGLEASRGEERAARDAWRRAARDIAAAQAALEEAQEGLIELNSRRSALEEAQTRLAASLAEARALVAEAETGLAGLADESSIVAGLGETQSVLDALRAAAEEARLAFAAFDNAAAARRTRLHQIGEERASWERRLADASAHLGALAQRRREAEEQLKILATSPAALADKTVRLDEQIAEATGLRSKAGDRLAAAETTHKEYDRASREAAEALSAAREDAARYEERLASLKAQRAQIERQITEILGIKAEQTGEVAGLKPEAQLPEEAQVEAKVDRLKRERERLGGVNLRAEQEAEEVQDRLTTLVADREDLVGAIAKLRSGIQSLNREGRARLTEAFEAVNGHFRDLFTLLFGGGTAELTFVESDDPLEAGLEIIARPPGKKPQTMTLLSGGEQALTALSLIFAVFLTNPAPICVLDEVDAPLDDANVERFCDLLDSMREKTETRFMVITHNPITMSRMDRLFGVTMVEKGVSQLVSVDLKTAETFREAS